jgi:hypothetical protein
MNPDPQTKIRMLKSSMRCFVFGLLGLIPLIGLPFALAALWISGRVRAQEKQMWNAAQPYRIWGAISAAVGTVLWTGVLMIVIARLVMIAQGLG